MELLDLVIYKLNLPSFKQNNLTQASFKFTKKVQQKFCLIKIMRAALFWGLEILSTLAAFLAPVQKQMKCGKYTELHTLSKTKLDIKHFSLCNTPN